MLVTDMWQRNEHSRNLYAPETSERADDEDPPSWESRFAQVLRTEGHPCATLTGTSSIPGIGRARVASGWQDYRNSSHGRSCSTPPHGRMNPSFAETLSVKYHPYHDASTVGRHDHQVAAFGTRAIDSAEGHGDSSLGHNKAVAFDEVMTARERMSNCQHDSEISSKNDAAYLGENQPGNFTGRPHVGELPRMSNVDPNGPINHREAGIVLGHLHTKSRSRNNLVDLGPGNQDVRSDFRIEKMAFSSSETHLSLPYQEASGLHSGFKNHGMESYPRRYSSVLDNTPVIVHQYEENKYQTHGRSKRSSIPVHFPPAAAASKHASKDNYSIKDSANRRQRCHQSSPQLDLESEIRRRRSADISGTSHFPSHRFSDSNKESLLHFPPASAGGSSTTASSPCADHGSLSMSSPASLPPLTPTSPHLAVPTASIPKSLSRPPNELSDSSFTSAAETSQPSSPSKPRATLARSHVPKKHSSKDLCVICGDKASGYHYNTLSCEGCKGFFRRTITRNLHYHCKYGGNCVMDMWMRRKCPACRLKRCKQVGMREECLLTEHQCVIRNTRRRMKMRKKEEETEVQPKSESSDISPDDTQAILASLNSDHKDLIERLVNLQDKYELPSDEDLKLLKEDKMYNAPSQEDLSDAIFVHMVEMTILVTRLIVEFAKSLPGFRNLVKEDQIVLLKSSSSEVMMLRTARRYNSETNTIIFGNGVPFSPSSMAFGGLQESVESLFNFSRSMSSLYVDNAEYALLTAMCIFSVRSGLTNPSVVDKLQEVYMDVLIAYVGKRRSKCQNYLAKLLMKFVHLRTLGHEHSRTLYNLTLKKGSLPPLLTEYFDISE